MRCNSRLVKRHAQPNKCAAPRVETITSRLYSKSTWISVHNGCVRSPQTSCRQRLLGSSSKCCAQWNRQRCAHWRV